MMHLANKRRWVIWMVAGPILVAMSAAGAARAASDSCSAATVVDVGIFSGNTSAATNDGAASCGGTNPSPDEWYSFTPASDCLLTLDTCAGGYDTVLSIHSSCPGTTANELVCNDDLCATQSNVELSLAGGTTYLIRVGGWDGASGAYTLNVSCNEQPPSDDCADAIVIGEGTFSGDTLSATNDGSASCGTSQTSPDVWFSFTAASDCLLLIDTCGATWDTVVSVHSACPGTSANELNCSDDACNTQSRVAVAATADSTYLIRVAGWEGATGVFPLHVTCTPGGRPGGGRIHRGADGVRAVRPRRRHRGMRDRLAAMQFGYAAA